MKSFFHSFFYFSKLLFIQNKVDVVFYYPQHFNRGASGENLYFEPLYQACDNNNLSYLVFEEIDFKSDKPRNKNTIPFDFIFYIIFFFRKLYLTDISIGKFLSWVVTILIVINFWIFFRSDSIDMALNYISLMYQNINIPQAYTNVSYLLIILAAIDLLWSGNTRLERPIFKSAFLELFTLSCMLAGIFFYAFFNGTDNAFIYFQF